jgi:hypothetical protein
MRAEILVDLVGPLQGTVAPPCESCRGPGRGRDVPATAGSVVEARRRDRRSPIRDHAFLRSRNLRAWSATTSFKSCASRRSCLTSFGVCRLQETPSTRNNTSSRRWSPAVKAQRSSFGRASGRARCGSSLRQNIASASPADIADKLLGRNRGSINRISVSSSLFGGYDEPEMLCSSSC